MRKLEQTTEEILDEFKSYINDVLKHGQDKYSEQNWTRVDGIKSSKKEMLESILRHVYASREDLQHDEESGLHPLAHAASRCLMVIWREKRGLK